MSITTVFSEPLSGGMMFSEHLSLLV